MDGFTGDEDAGANRPQHPQTMSRFGHRRNKSSICKNIDDSRLKEAFIA
jgi:hypothetical protein